MLALLIPAAVVVVVVVAVLLSRRLTRDDEHSVAGYHKQLLTLEQIKAHTLPGGADADADAAASDASGAGASRPVKPSYPESAVRVSGSPYVRVTDGPNPTPVPPVPPPPVAGANGLVTFDDAGPVVVPSGRSANGTETFSFGRKDRAMDSMNRRPRRLGGPIVAVSVVAVVIVVLVVAGSHKNPPAKHHLSTTATTGTASRSHKAKTHPKRTVNTTTTTQLPLVSLPSATSVHDANYTTRLTDYSLVVSATTSECYVQVDNVGTGTAVFAGVLTAGEQRTIPVTGPVTIDVGAPSAFAATVNGTPVVLPYGYQTPFNLHLVPAGSSVSSGTTTTTTTSG